MRCGRFVWLVLGLLAGGSLFGTSTHAADVTKFDIAGVRLYMSGEEAINALEKTFGEVARDKCVFHKEESRLKPGTKIQTLIMCQIHDPFEVFVRLTERVPPEDKRPEAVYAIEYYVDRPPATEGDFEQTYRAAVKKYGRADTVRMSQYQQLYPVTAGWCALLPGHDISYTAFDGLCSREPALEFSTNPGHPVAKNPIHLGLALHDDDYAKKVDEAAQRLPHGKPQF